MTYTARPSAVSQPASAPALPQGPDQAPHAAAGDPAARGDGAPAAEGAPAAAKPARKERDPFFDNAKFLAILLVVVGHALGGVLRSPLAESVYMFIYMFHMPLFIVVTGYFSRNWTFSSGKARKLIATVGVPYVIFEFAYSAYDWLVGGNELKVTLLDPYYLTWFLCALFLWRLSTPVWQQIRWPLAVAALFSLLSYMTDLGATLNLHRVIGLLPFYVMGLMLKPQHFELIKKPQARLLGIVVLIGGFAVAYLTMNHMARGWVYWDHSFRHFGVDNITGIAMRLAMFACATTLLFAFLTIVPRRKTWFTALGAYTLYAYLLHGFFTKLLSFAGVWKTDWAASVPGVLTLIVGSLVLGTLLCTLPVVRSTKWLLEPNTTWVFTKLRRPGGGRAKRQAKATPGEDRGTVSAEMGR
ncbi:acyltransferase family protein [Actinomadura rudentiformis]|uniref:Acyltransferase family protein n=1 Tax=Actinomadura rudentiformis TaxID=359158 RepID=A0A6H9YTE1_9ACTN|nr:acyltransferase family protein [Actinomadura rudentiformis]KAB2351544.1 acyltransferase family protein [Actinomadura rudentiformis]